MNTEEKRKALAKWILETDENILNEVEAIYNVSSQEKEADSKFVAYTVNGEGLTKEKYIKHINDIRDSVNNGAKTYTTEEVRKYVLNNRNS